MVSTDSTLLMEDIDKYFFGKAANDKVSLEVKRGEIHALLGENGAGKTTLMNILYGIYQRDAGTITWKGEDVHFESPREAIDNRIGMVHQHFMLVPTLTVSQNITLGLKSEGHPFPNRRSIDEKICEILRTYGVNISPTDKVSSLSVGGEQWVEIIKLLYRNAELLILDEPTAVLTPQETERFFDVLKKLRQEGHSVIIITHRIPEVLAITDRVTILRDGRNVATIKTADTDSVELSHYMIGRELKTISRTPHVVSPQDEGLGLDELAVEENGRAVLGPLSLSIRKGEMIGIAGVDGNGQKHLAEVVLGVRDCSAGKVRLLGKDVSSASIQQRKDLGLGYIAEDRQNDALIMDMDMRENVLLRMYSKREYVRSGFIKYASIHEATKEMIDTYNIKTAGPGKPVRYLSGGNQQKLILARELSGSPPVIVAFHPTRGLDIGATEFVRQKLLERRASGSSILLISADLDEIFSLSDRIAVLFHGRLMAVLENDGNVDVNYLGRLMAGESAGSSSERRVE
ncbi:MAG: ABC transporter ATP-binding protein [Spirochaetia bacterium]|nr:ABC transporter ATP-binding protein [Spirochaetia bacterium]